MPPEALAGRSPKAQMRRRLRCSPTASSSAFSTVGQSKVATDMSAYWLAPAATHGPSPSQKLLPSGATVMKAVAGRRGGSGSREGAALGGGRAITALDVVTGGAGERRAGETLRAAGMRDGVATTAGGSCTTGALLVLAEEAASLALAGEVSGGLKTRRARAPPASEVASVDA